MRRKNLPHSAGDTIAAISTPPGEGGIGIVRLSGKRALPIADKIFVSKDNAKPSGFKTYTTHYGHIVQSPSLRGRDSARSNLNEIASSPCPPSAGETPRNDTSTPNEIIDEVLLTVMRAPKSYTKEDIVEINCHSGIVPLRKILDLALGLGARLAEPGEFTKRAFINGRIDLAQAEAVLDIIKARTESSMRVALGHLEGEFSGTIRGLKTSLLNALSEIEAQIDFSEEDIKPASREGISACLEGILREIRKLIDDAWKGIIFKEGILCVICGKPNTGKSSLMNTLLRRNRVIVTPVPGTTRDAIEEEINLRGMPLRIVDTAGISRPKNIIEKHGIRKSRSYIKMADLILFMVDLSRPWSKPDDNIFKAIKGKNFITIANKSDLKRKLDIKKLEASASGKPVIEVSLLKRKNLEKLEGEILRKVWRGEIPHPEGVFVSNLRQKKELELAENSLKRAKTALGKSNFSPEIVASDLRDAVSSLGSILGDTVEPDILNTIFSKFCVGK